MKTTTLRELRYGDLFQYGDIFQSHAGLQVPINKDLYGGRYGDSPATNARGSKEYPTYSSGKFLRPAGATSWLGIAALAGLAWAARRG